MIVTQVLKQLLPEKKIYTSPKNFNSEIGLILSIFQIESYEPNISNLLGLFFKILYSILFPKNTPDIFVLEYGIDHPHDMKFLTMISKADIAIFTKLDAVHSAYFKSIEDIGNEKFLLMKSARKRVYLNALDDYCRGHAENLRPEVRFYNQ
jgi:UDP-N-acetylmuramyl pentapeptide synthase